MDRELEEIKQRKLAALNQQLQEQQAEQEKIADQLTKLEALIKPKLTREAQLRFGNVKLAHPENAARALVSLAGMSKNMSQIDDETLKRVLGHIQDTKNITLRRT